MLLESGMDEDEVNRRYDKCIGVSDKKMGIYKIKNKKIRFWSEKKWSEYAINGNYVVVYYFSRAMKSRLYAIVLLSKNGLYAINGKILLKFKVEINLILLK